MESFLNVDFGDGFILLKVPLKFCTNKYIIAIVAVIIVNTINFRQWLLESKMWNDQLPCLMRDLKYARLRNAPYLFSAGLCFVS